MPSLQSPHGRNHQRGRRRLVPPQPVIYSLSQPAVGPLSPSATIGSKHWRRGNLRQMPLINDPHAYLQTRRVNRDNTIDLEDTLSISESVEI
jgi:hypothetical protein